jgi:hypothetical protein
MILLHRMHARVQIFKWLATVVYSVARHCHHHNSHAPLPSQWFDRWPPHNWHGDRHEKLGTSVRKMLKQQYGIEGGVTVVTSTEMPRKAFALTASKTKNKASYYGTWACVPAAFGLQAASVSQRPIPYPSNSQCDFRGVCFCGFYSCAGCAERDSFGNTSN